MGSVKHTSCRLWVAPRKRVPVGVLIAVVFSIALVYAAALAKPLQVAGLPVT